MSALGLAFLIGRYAGVHFAFWGLIFGILAVLAVVRRWSWTEAERSRIQTEFLIWRGENPDATRSDFTEDLRDEALFGLLFLFLLVPLALQQVQVSSCAFGPCAFAFEGADGHQAGKIPGLFAWLGFFGAELAKSVPLVDWSEVFHVANESPIKPKTALGAQVVFVMRASLDLLLIGAILQAVQITGRLRVQYDAFRAGQLPVLDGFNEAEEFRRVWNNIHHELDIRAIEQAAIKSFPRYDEARLKQMVLGINLIDDEPGIRGAAAAVLAEQYPSYENYGLLGEQANATTDEELRPWLGSVVSGLFREPDAKRDEAHRGRLTSLLNDPTEAVTTRHAAAGQLGRLPRTDGSVECLTERLMDDDTTVPIVRAAAAVALAKWEVLDAKNATVALAARLEDVRIEERATAAMATAYALARHSNSVRSEEIASHFPDDLQEFASQAALFQPEPISIKDAKANEDEAGSYLNQTVLITPGRGNCLQSFLMGSPDTDPDADDDEKPQTEITMNRDFAMGRYQVTVAEVDLMVRALGGDSKRYWDYSPKGDDDRVAARNLNWHDAMRYCSWLEAVTGDRYRLPTEAEWEYACRAGTTTRYWFGDDAEELEKYAWFDINSDAVQPVGLKPGNPFGLHDMHGNV